jgi:hypothetical protein
MHIGSKTRYAKKHLAEDKQDTTEREIEVPWVGTAEIAVRWKSKRVGGEWVTEKVVVPEDLEAQLAKNAYGVQSETERIVWFHPVEGFEAVPRDGWCLFVTEIIPYVFSPVVYPQLRGTSAEVRIADLQVIAKVFFDRDRYSMGVSSIRLGEPAVVPPRQPLSVQLHTDAGGAASILEAVKAVTETDHDTFLLGVKLVGFYRVRAKVRGVD